MKMEAKLSMIFGIILAVCAVFIAVAVTMLHLYAENLQIVPLLILATAGIILLSIVGALWGKMKREVAEPIQNISAYTDRLAHGEANDTLRNIPDGDMGDIANSLNKVYADIAELKKFSEALLKQAINDSPIIAAPSELGRSLFGIAEAMSKVVNEYNKEFAETAEVINKVTAGELNAHLRLRNSREHWRAMDKMVKTVQNLHTDMNGLTQSAADGSFQSGISEDKYDGLWQKMVEGINAANKNAHTHLSEVERGLTALSKGNVAQRVTQDGKGEYGKLKTALNNVSNSLEKLMTNIEGDLASAAAKTRPRNDYPGDFLKIRNSINHLVDRLEVESVPVSAPATPVARPFVPSTREERHARAARADTNRMSGAKKVLDISTLGPSPEFLKSDFGKY